MNNIQSPILTISSISYILGSIILSELGDIHGFSSTSKLVAFTGLDPSTHQSVILELTMCLRLKEISLI
ncbi:transposase [Miniphocaeibacter halophilus]|uniref:Transposase n=1 Tax=Miniphocaeibacter halophilus TaxID=2931922 RepID=A0AC61N0P1_9FIRM|nr:transposase [Miniphocaeibacter halophilus]